MTLGDKIKKARTMRNLTQSELALKLGLPTFRIGQYETGIRNPKSAQLQEIADALEVNIEYFKDRSLDTYNDVMHALFELEQTFELEISSTEEGKISFNFNDKTLSSYLEAWQKEKGKAIYSQKTKDSYEEWKITFPNQISDDWHKKIKAKRKELSEE